MGLKPNEIKDLHLWEFNQYVLAYQEKIKEKEKNIIKMAYYTASFNRSKKSKSLEHYLDKIDSTPKEIKPRNSQKLEYARKMHEKIHNRQNSTKTDKKL